jgi:undecaprenyl-diphosphatase
MDQAIFSFSNSLLGKSVVFDSLIKFLAVYLIYSIPLFLIIYWFLGTKKTALRAALAGGLAWQGFAKLIGHLYFRPRPIVSLPAKELIFHRPDYSFPSDHATFLFALAFSFYLAGERKISYWLFVIGIFISVSRVVVGFHYPSDVLAGWVLGIFVAWLLWLAKDPIDKWIIEPLIWLAKKMRLAQ